MKEQEARKIIAKLTYEEKVRLNEMLKSLEQMRQPFAASSGVKSARRLINSSSKAASAL